MNNERKVVELNISDVLPNRFQPRIKFNETSINELADSIKEHGVIQPIVVRPIGDKYEIIAGERRYKASVLASKQTIPAIVTTLNDKDSAEVALIENVQRQDLTPIEEAISYKKILDMGYLTQEQLALKLGKNQSTIANKIRLLNLDEEVQEALLDNKISERHARSLLKITDNSKQINMLNRIINERLTVRKTDEEINKLLTSSNESTIVEELNNKVNASTENIMVEEQKDVKPIEILDYANIIAEEENKMGNNDLNIPVSPIIDEQPEDNYNGIPNLETNNLAENNQVMDMNIPEIKNEESTMNLNNSIPEPSLDSIDFGNPFAEMESMMNNTEVTSSEPSFNDLPTNTFNPDFLNTVPLDGEINQNETEIHNNLNVSSTDLNMPTNSIIEEEEPINLEANNIINNSFDINPGFVDVEKIENEAEDIYKEKPLADLDSLLKSDIIPGLNDLGKEINPEPVIEKPEEPKFKFFNFDPEEENEKDEPKEEQPLPFDFNPVLNPSSENNVGVKEEQNPFDFNSSISPFELNNDSNTNSFNFNPVIEPTLENNNTEISYSADDAVDINALYGLTPEPTPIIPTSEEKEEEPVMEEKPEEIVPPFVENIESGEPNMNFGENIFNAVPETTNNIDYSKFYDNDEEHSVENVDNNTQVEDNNSAEAPQTFNYPEDNNMAESVKKEESVVINNPEVINNKVSLKEVISIIRECSDKIEKLGYYIDTEEFDFEDIYQVIFKINKN